ncbi:MAG: hypothetical protein KDI21_03035 [Halieaceae bacterium]|nr:hypothetical protein [Halieaceae bacterium]
MRAMMMIPAMFLAMNVAAQCPVTKPRTLPVIPDAAVATEREMYDAQLAVEAFIERSELYLECSYMNSRQHNTLVSQLEIVAEQYNRELNEYRERQRLVAGAD